MELNNHFTVPASLETTWEALLDIERVAAALPGTTLDTVSEGSASGSMLVKLGPMRIRYEGTAEIVSADPDTRHILIRAQAKEQRGAGTASADVEVEVSPSDAGTSVSMRSKVDVTGRPAQMGHGLIEEVAQHLTDEFAGRLAEGLGAGATAAVPPPRAEALDLGSAAAAPLARRLIPAVGIAAVVAAVVWIVIRSLR